MEKLKVFTAFSGYDSQCMALERLASDFPGFAYELVGWSEIDRCAIEAHNACFPQWADRNYGDISEIDWGEVPDFDLFTYSFPCQDISVAGHQNGLSEGSGTRSSLLWECERAIASKRPKYLLMENVAALTHRKFVPQLMRWEDILSGYGYANHRRVLNASDFGVPQSRNRVFLASLLDGIRFVFPTPVTPPHKQLEDLLDRDVDESYYFSNEYLHKCLLRIGNIPGKSRIRVVADAMEKGTIQRRIYGTDGVSPTLTANVHPIKVWIPEAGAVPKVSESVHLKFQFRDPADVAPTLCASDYKCPCLAWYNGRVRKLTPGEYLRLMDVPEDKITAIQSHICDNGKTISKSQQYKMAGNSIVVSVLYHIFRKMFTDRDTKSPIYRQLTIFDEIIQ